jgi:uncharacterized protein YkwD
LASSACLDAVAQAWAEHMAATGRLAHNPGLASQAGSCWPWGAVGENVGYDWSVDGLCGAWMASSAHRSNILSANYSQAGVGMAVDAAGTVWASVVFLG